LHALLGEVLKDPSLNTEEYLEDRVKELMKLKDAELQELGAMGRQSKDEKEQEELMKIYRKHKVG